MLVLLVMIWVRVRREVINDDVLRYFTWLSGVIDCSEWLRDLSGKYVMLVYLYGVLRISEVTSPEEKIIIQCLSPAA